MKIRTRLTFFYSGVTLLILLTFSFFLYLAMRIMIFQEIDQNLSMTADTISASSAQLALFNGIDDRLAGLKRNTEFGFEVLAADGSVLFRGGITNSVRHDPALLTTRKTVRFVNYKIETVRENIRLRKPSEAGRSFRVLSKKFFYKDRFIGWIQVAQPIDRVVGQLGLLTRALLVFIAVFTIIISLSGYFLAKESLAPIHSIIDSANRITDANLSERIRPPGSRDELSNLIDTLNRLFDRLEASFQTQKQFISDAAHELKTPLAILRSGMETELNDDGVDDRIKRRLSRDIDTLSRLSTLVEKLLLLSRLENRRVEMKAEALDLKLLVENVAETLALLAEEKGQVLTLDLADGVRTRGDRDLLYHAFSNILNNAIKYTPEGGHITASLGARGDLAVAVIRDDGIGMNLEELRNAFNRFYRADNSRSLEKGYGLGLSITRWIVVLHGGSIDLTPGPSGGITATISLPLARDPPA
jgi:signal transduction histidine kinase